MLSCFPSNRSIPGCVFLSPFTPFNRGRKGTALCHKHLELFFAAQTCPTRVFCRRAGDLVLSLWSSCSTIAMPGLWEMRFDASPLSYFELKRHQLHIPFGILSMIGIQQISSSKRLLIMCEQFWGFPNKSLPRQTARPDAPAKQHVLIVLFSFSQERSIASILLSQEAQLSPCLWHFCAPWHGFGFVYHRP